MNKKQVVKGVSVKKSDELSELMKLEAKYCSWGDTVHYAKKLKIFQRVRRYLFI